MAYERIDKSEKFDGKIRDEHEVRYRIARQFIENGDVVMDAGCGVGYGHPILMMGVDKAYYTAFDKNPVENVNFGDLNTMQGFGTDFFRVPKFDVFVGLEFIEHLEDRGVKNFVTLAKKAKKYIVVSTPIVKNSNPFHIQQFEKEGVIDLFEDGNWMMYMYFEQDSTYGVFIFKRI
jgi:2-polyprenyl-3-methyl-5-hydroxy-6-metoxy-1,4-benzoquinol methylase